jgi:hypothetical protein
MKNNRVAHKKDHEKMTIATVLVALLMFSTVVSCGKVTKENYDKLKVGMEYSQVVNILGDPKECNAVLNAKNCNWVDGSKSINVRIIADKVVFVSSKGL